MCYSRINRDKFKSNRPHFLQPQSYDPREYFPKGPARQHCDDARYWPDAIIRGTDNDRADEDGYVPLSSDVARESVSRKYGFQARDEMLTKGAIERTPDYEIGVRSYGYRLAERFQHEDVVWVAIEDERIIRATLELIAKKEAEQEALRLPIHYELMRLTDKFLEIVLPHASRILAELPDKSNKHNRQGRLCEALAERRLRFTIGPTTGRFYTPYSHLKRELRASLRIGDSPLAGLDIANSQPLLAAYLMQQGAPHVTGTTNGTTYSMSRQQIDVSPLASDAVWFREVCEEGRLYEVLLAEVNYDRERLMTRDQLKKAFMPGILSVKGPLKWDAKEVSEAFRRLFPSVWRFIAAFNRKDHGNLIRAAQRKESNLVIHGVCERWVERYPGEPVFPLHDSLYVRPEALGDLRAVFHEELAKHGIRATLREQNYSAQTESTLALAA